MTELRVVIIGAGISGLSCAHSLLVNSRRLGVEPQITLLEAEPSIGGKIRTESLDGYLLEWGPNGFLDNSPPTLDLCRELGLQDRLVPAESAAERRFIVQSGRLVPIPGSPRTFFFSPLLPLRGRLRVLLEPFIGRGRGEESVEAFARRRLGPDVARTLIDAMVTGIYAGDPGKLSLQAAFPKLYQLEQRYGSLIVAQIRQAQERKRRAKDPDKETRTPRSPGLGGTLTSFRGGLSELIDAFPDSIGSELIRTGEPVREIVREESQYLVRTETSELPADFLVLALPPHRAAPLVAQISPPLARKLEAFESVPVAVACFGFRREQIDHPLDGFGFLVPSMENRPVLGCLFSSSIFSGRAPRGRVLLRVLLGGDRHPTICTRPDAEISDTALDLLRPVLSITGPPEMTRVFRHEKAIPQYTLGHKQRVQEVFDVASQVGGLSLTGNAYHGVGLNDCIKNGRQHGQYLADTLQAIKSELPS